LPYARPEMDPQEIIERMKQILVGTPTPGMRPAGNPNESPVVARAKAAFKKRLLGREIDMMEERIGPQSEDRTFNFTICDLIDTDKIINDPRFKNFRLSMDPVKQTELVESIRLEGLKVPIVVVEAPVPDCYHVRAGFRRTLAVRHLGWKQIPAIILPLDTPETEEYWINILENTAREKLSSYELANAARMMRDRFGIKAADFAAKSGHSQGHIEKLLSCIDRLPPEVLHSWQRGDRVPLDILVKLSAMTPVEAMKNLRLWLGQHRITADEALARIKKPPAQPGKLWTVAGIERTQKLMIAIKMSDLDPKTKRLCMDVVEFCQGCRKRIDGIVDEDHRLPAREFVLPDPEPGETMDPAHPEPAEPPPLPSLHDVSPADFVPTFPGKPRTSS
jgi:ParB/RepB/Spo0J family partition protein